MNLRSEEIAHVLWRILDHVQVFFPRIQHHMGVRRNPLVRQEPQGVVYRDDLEAAPLVVFDGLHAVRKRGTAADDDAALVLLTEA